MAQWYKSSSMPETLTQKTINAADNTITNIAVSNLSTDAVATTIGDSPVDSKLSTEKAVSTALATKQNIVQFATVPTASASNVGQVIQYTGTTTTDYTNGYFYQCAEVTPATTPATYHWVAKTVQEGGASAWGDISGKPFEELGTTVVKDADSKLQVNAVTSTTSWQTTTDDIHFPSEKLVKTSLDDKQDVMQVTTLPTASASILGKIVQYIGTTTTTETNGYFYQCVEDTTVTPTGYKWTAKSVQAGGSGASAWGDISGKPFTSLGDDFIVDSAEDKLHVKAVTSVSSWQTTTDDLHFPTEKLVKAALDVKQADILTSISGTGGQVLARNAANNALEFKTVSGGTADIDNITIIKDADTGKLKTAIGGGWENMESEYPLPTTSFTGTLKPSGIIPIDVIAFDYEQLASFWNIGQELIITLKMGTYSSTFRKQLGTITLFSTDLTGVQFTDAVFGSVTLARINMSGYGVVVNTTNHMDETTFSLDNVKAIVPYQTLHHIGTDFIPIDTRVLGVTIDSPQKITLNYPFGEWEQTEWDEKGYLRSGVPETKSANSFTAKLTYVGLSSGEWFRGKQAKIEYTVAYQDGGEEKVSGNLIVQFSEGTSLDDIVASDIVDTTGMFNGGSIRIPMSDPAKSLMVFTEGPTGTWDLGGRDYNLEISASLSVTSTHVEKINAAYVNINTDSFPEQETTEAGKAWGILSDGKTGLISGGGGGSATYAGLSDKPKIGGNTLNANDNTYASLGLASLTGVESLTNKSIDCNVGGNNITALNPTNSIALQTDADVGKAWGILANKTTGLITPVPAIDNYTVLKDANNKLYTAMGGGIATDTEETLILETVGGVFSPATTEHPDVVYFPSFDWAFNWEEDYIYKFRLVYVDDYADIVGRIGHITVEGIDRLGFTVSTGASYLGDVTVWSDDNNNIMTCSTLHMPTSHVSGFLAQNVIKAVETEDVKHPFDAEFIPVDEHVLEVSDDGKLTFVNPFGTWDEDEEETIAGERSLTPTLTTTSITVVVPLEDGKYQTSLVDSDFKITYIFYKGTTPYEGEITGSFGEYQVTMKCLNLKDDGIFDGGKVAITTVTDAGVNKLQITLTLSYRSTFDLTTITEVGRLYLDKINKISTIHQIDGDYCNIGYFEVSDGEPPSVDITYAQVESRYPGIMAHNQGTGCYMRFSRQNPDDNSFVFTGTYIDGTNLHVEELVMKSDGTNTITTKILAFDT